ncbi:MAG: response regulator transcription factor [Chloroflexota bacterium]
MTDIIKVILADDHQIVRQGMRALLALQPDINVVSEASDGVELLEMIERLSPDVVITDIAMPNLNGMDATRQIKKIYPHIQVIILSMHAATAYVVGSLKAGALGYILKNDDFQQVVDAVYCVHKGQRYLSSQVSESMITELLNSDPTNLKKEPKLTKREAEIIQLIADGKTSLQIGEILGLSIRTVEKHRANFKAKLRLNSQAEVVHYAIQKGYVALKE